MSKNQPKPVRPPKNPLKLSVAQFADAQEPKITRQRVNELVVRGDLIRGDDRKIDVTHPVNSAWLASRKGCPPPTTPPGRWAKPAAPAAPTPRPAGHVPTAAVPPPPASAETYINDENATDALTRLLSATNIQTMTLADVQKVRQIETALKTRVEREHKRRDLIERSLVRTVFGRIYQVESQEMKTLGGKLAPDVAGLMGIDDPTIQLMVEQRIDGEILKSLAHVKRIINDFLTNMDTGVIGDE
jgi:hypothetical protein